ncbi:MAG: phospholipase [Ruminococcaceae bacterium]|nr:phospholipase [Oscillospiraceae bacterium]
MKRTECRGSQWAFPFVKYSPENEKSNLPLVVQLHGAGERGKGGDDLSKVDVHGFSKLMAKNEYDCIFVMPQCPPDTFWAAKVESIISFIQKISEEFEVDKQRIYLTGLSMGGYGTWFTAMACPRMFAAISPVCGGGMPWNAGVLDMPVWVFHGVEDSVVSVVNSDHMVQSIKARGGDVTYSRVEGVGHNVWEHAYNDKLIEWLMSKNRKL